MKRTISRSLSTSALLLGLASLPAWAQLQPQANVDAEQYDSGVSRLPGLRTATSFNWTGYAVQGSSFTDVYAYWYVPSVNCEFLPTAGSDFWVGFDGLGLPSTGAHPEQAGTSSDCVAGSPTYYMWGQFSKEIRQVCSQVSVGDYMKAEVTYDPSSQKFSTMVTDESNSGIPPAWVSRLPCRARSEHRRNGLSKRAKLTLPISWDSRAFSVPMRRTQPMQAESKISHRPSLSA